MEARKKFFIVLILGLLSAVGPFSIDMYLPGFTAIAQDLHTTVGRVSLSLSSFFIGISFGQFVYGPLLDRFGRKKPLYIGLLIYIIASIGCAMASTVEMLIALRLLQALGSCAGMVAARAMVRDLFPVTETAKIFSKLILVIAVSPIIAPTLGGFVTAHFGWHYVFGILTGMSVLILLLVHYFLPESQQPDKSFSLQPANIFKNYVMVMKDPQFYTYALTGSVASAGLYAYITSSPNVFLNIFGVTEQQYGWIFALVALCLILSSQLNSFFLRRFSSKQITRVALAIQAIIGIILLILSLNHWLTLFNSIILLSAFLSCQGFIFPNSSALSLAPFGKTAGSASALMGGLQMGIGATASAIVSLFSSPSTLPMAGTMAACSVAGLIILLGGNQRIRVTANRQKVEEQTTEMIKEM